MTTNAWHTDKPPKHLYVWVWWQCVQMMAYWTGKVWRAVDTGAILNDITHWRALER